MADQFFKYIIVGGGLAGASAAKGIRELDKDGSILIIGKEGHIPYNRPPLSKKLWQGKVKLEDIVVEYGGFYPTNGIYLAPGVEVTKIYSGAKTVIDAQGETYRYEKLLLATGAVPRKLDIPGGDLEGIFYYRYMDDYLALRPQVGEGKSAVVVGGGFIGSEMAAALNMNGVDVTMLFPDPYIVHRVFPADLSKAIQDDYLDRGVKVLAGDVPVRFERHGDKFLTSSKNGENIESDIIIVGIGVTPSVELAEKAGLKVQNGVVVNEYLQASNPDVYAAGDIAYFPYQVFGEQRRVEHWDNALNQGSYAGRNMAGANQPYDYMPYFWSDLFDFGYEAVGDTDSRLEIFADWQEEYKTGVIYYLKDGKVKGAMMCNVWDKVDEARALIKEGKEMTPDDLIGAIK